MAALVFKKVAIVSLENNASADDIFTYLFMVSVNGQMIFSKLWFDDTNTATPAKVAIAALNCYKAFFSQVFSRTTYNFHLSIFSFLYVLN